MTRFGRSLPLLWVVVLWCATSRAAVGHGAGPPLDDPLASTSVRVHAAAAADSVTPASASTAPAGVPDTTNARAVASSTPGDAAPQDESKDSRVDKRVWVIMIAATAVAVLVVLAGR